MKQIDARGVSCPQPVLMTKKGLNESPDGIDVLVDNATAKGNVQRFMNNAGYRVDIKEQNDYYVMSARK